VKALLATLLLAFAARAQEVVVLVRHAEKADASPDTRLSEAGNRRAQALAAKLRDAGITSIWTTELKRTQETAKPLADALGLTPHVHTAKDTPGLVAELRKEKGRVLVVGHSNTLPDIAQALGGRISPLGEDEYDALFVLAGQTMVKLRQ
jgi:broad specificity phosphatase PhoE